MAGNRSRIIDRAGTALRWTEAHLPVGVRSAIGLVLMAGGTLGFLPILGFWMLPLGVAFLALDIPPLRRRVHLWFRRRGVEL